MQELLPREVNYSKCRCNQRRLINRTFYQISYDLFITILRQQFVGEWGSVELKINVDSQLEGCKRARKPDHYFACATMVGICRGGLADSPRSFSRVRLDSWSTFSTIRQIWKGVNIVWVRMNEDLLLTNLLFSISSYL